MAASSPAERFFAKVIKVDNGCWLWSGGHTSGGYPVFRIGSLKDGTRRQIGAHVFACVLRHGPMPAGHDAHHTCRNKGCVNPDHLVPVNQRDHTTEHRDELIAHGQKQAQRPAFRAAFGRAQREKTHCRNGHPYNAVNTYQHRGERHCRLCAKAAGIRNRIRKGQAITPSIRAWLDAFNRDVAESAKC